MTPRHMPDHSAEATTAVRQPTRVGLCGPRARSNIGRRISRFTSLVAILASLALAVVLILAASAVQGCANFGLHPAATLKLKRQSTTPKDASVTIDETYIGPLAYVAASGVRLRAGEHRISVEKEGYFPFDEIVEIVGDEETIHLNVELIPIPD